MLPTQKLAEEIAGDLMGIASKIREGGDEVEMMFGFYHPANGLGMVPAAVIPNHTETTVELAERVRLAAQKMGAVMVFHVCESWASVAPEGGELPKVRPSEDPNRKEIIMVTASGQNVSVCMMRDINPDGTLGEVQTVQGAGGTMSNLSGQEVYH